MKQNQYICRQMLFRVLWPSLISAAALSIADIADALVVGTRMGQEGLAAIGIVTPVYMIFNLIGYGISTGGCVTYSRLVAEGKEEEALGHFKRLSLWMLILSAVLTAAGNLLLYPFLALLGVDGSDPLLLKLCLQYARPMFSMTVVFMFNYILYDFVRCDDDASLAAIGFSAGCITDLVLNIVFVLFLGMGVSGSILATIIAQTISVGILAVHLFGKRGILQLKRLTKVPFGSRRAAGRSLKIGLTTSVRYIFQFFFLAISNRLMLYAGSRGVIEGSLYVAIFDVVMNVSYVLYGLYQAFSDTMQPLAATFSAEHDGDSLGYLLKLVLKIGIGIGIAAAVLVSMLAAPISSLFGLTAAEEIQYTVPAIRIFCLSTPLAGVILILSGYDQSSGRDRMSGTATLLRMAICLLPLTFLFGLLAPERFWWLFPCCESSALVLLLLIRRLYGAKEAMVGVFSMTLDNDHQELVRVIDGVTAYCDSRNISPVKAMQIRLAVEELCAITIEKAFTGKPYEYIRLTLAEETDGTYVMHIRNSAAYFNPLDMRMGKLVSDSQDDLMESMGVMLVKKFAKSLHYRNYEGFNVMTVVL